MDKLITGVIVGILIYLIYVGLFERKVRMYYYNKQLAIFKNSGK
jgi:hypothetical protein